MAYEPAGRTKAINIKTLNILLNCSIPTSYALRIMGVLPNHIPLPRFAGKGKMGAGAFIKMIGIPFLGSVAENSKLPLGSSRSGV